MCVILLFLVSYFSSHFGHPCTSVPEYHLISHFLDDSSFPFIF
uniref:Uncharacterized protein n=1 Tax=Rhizophora mucronata TaxID=61149 RepID=A0A2P2NHU4_RHIMU